MGRDRDAEDRSFEWAKPGGRDHVVAGITAHLAVGDRER